MRLGSDPSSRFPSQRHHSQSCDPPENIFETQGHRLAIGGIDTEKPGLVTEWDLDGASAYARHRNLLVDGLLVQPSRGDKTAIEFFRQGVRTLVSQLSIVG